MEIQYNSFFCDNSMTWHNMEQRAAFPVRRQLNYNRVTSQEEPLMQQQEQILHGGTFFVPCSEQELLFSLTLNMCLKKKYRYFFWFKSLTWHGSHKESQKAMNQPWSGMFRCTFHITTVQTEMPHLRNVWNCVKLLLLHSHLHHLKVTITTEAKSDIVCVCVCGWHSSDSKLNS